MTRSRVAAEKIAHLTVLLEPDANFPVKQGEWRKMSFG